MSDRDAERPLTDRITELLAAHRGAMQIKDVQDLRAACYGCEWVGPWRQSTMPANDDHDAHVAAVLADLMGDGLADAERAEAKIRELRERCYNDHRFTNENAPDVCDTCGTERK